jgi:hypothetical protein
MAGVNVNRVSHNVSPSGDRLAIVRERLFFEQLFFEAGFERTFGYPRHAPSLTAGDGLAQASHRRGISFRAF